MAERTEPADRRSKDQAKHDQLAARLRWLLQLVPRLELLAEDWQEGFGSKVDRDRPVPPPPVTCDTMLTPHRQSLGAAGEHSCVNPQPVEAEPQGHRPSSDPTAAVVLNRGEGHGLADDCVRLIAAIRLLEQTVRDLSVMAARVAPLDASKAAALAEGRESRNVGAGVCMCCTEGVPGVGEDRMVGGFCPKCYAAWKRAGMVDRQVFIRERRRFLLEKRRREQEATG